jgi:hypothetical protein
MSRGQEQASKRNSAPRGSRDRDWDLGFGNWADRLQRAGMALEHL